jgi:hypothetical protein
MEAEDSGVKCTDSGSQAQAELTKRTITVVVLGVLLFLVPAAEAAGTWPGLRLYTNHGTFRIAAPVSSTMTRTRTNPGATFSDGVFNPKTKPFDLRLGERVRLSLPAQPDVVLLYDAARLSYPSATIDLDFSNPVWRPNKVGTYVVSLNLKATWKSSADSGTSDSFWMFKVRVQRSR